MEIIFSKRFQKQAKKLVENKENLKSKINECIIDFSQHIRSSKFYRHPLKGAWQGFEEFK